MIYVSTTNVQEFIYYFGIFYLKIGKFYTFFQLGKGPQNQPRKILEHDDDDDDEVKNNVSPS